ncbi:hypothetical protein SHL15_9256 [Streptomyces hygroscopicus subsp. limoneus]|nr:hypothetical protein SHL15_7695 [Streptomyces hygroscopicus subsp. limoneus]ALP00172.1 hypothetical protein SHL15_9256 [Streptomyces hygroscopicus subsp. limoneus]
MPVQPTISNPIKSVNQWPAVTAVLGSLGIGFLFVDVGHAPMGNVSTFLGPIVAQLVACLGSRRNNGGD